MNQETMMIIDERWKFKNIDEIIVHIRNYKSKQNNRIYNYKYNN